MAWSSTKHINITAPTCSLQGSQVQVSDLKCGQESLSWLQLSELESTLVIYDKGTWDSRPEGPGVKALPPTCLT